MPKLSPYPLVVLLVSVQMLLVVGYRKFATRKRGGFPSYAIRWMAVATGLMAIIVIPAFAGPLVLRGVVAATALAASAAWFAAWIRLRTA